MQRSNELWAQRRALNEQLIVTQLEVAQKLGLMDSVLNLGSHLKSCTKSNQGLSILKIHLDTIVVARD